jgi:hypothetical protein
MDLYLPPSHYLNTPDTTLTPTRNATNSLQKPKMSPFSMITVQAVRSHASHNQTNIEHSCQSPVLAPYVLS